MMNLLRRLSDASRSVVVVTHSTHSVELCDRLIVMGRGGVMCFSGAPRAALSFFEVNQYDEIYGVVEELPPEEWQRRLAASEAGTSADTHAHSRATQMLETTRRRRRAGRQLGVLTARYLRTFVRDRRNLLILVAEVPVIALAIVGLFKGDVFSRSTGSPSNAAQLLFLLVTTALWLGSIDASREIIKERTIFERERAVGVRISAYLGSKTIVLFVLAALQTLLLAGIVFGLRPLDEPLETYGLVFAVLLMTAFVAIGIGLIISASVSTEDQATSFIPLVLILSCSSPARSSRSSRWAP